MAKQKSKGIQEKLKVLDLELNKIINCKFSLGEGLLVKPNKKFWVDINKSILATYEHNSLSHYNLDFIPSIVFEEEENKVILGSDRGIIDFSLSNQTKIITSKAPDILKEFRSNDGGYFSGDKLLSFMHKESPEENTGFIFKISNNSFEIFDKTMSIPNTFIEIEKSKIIISDSLTREIWLFEISEKGSIKKTLWTKLKKSCVPDGGCLVGDFVLISLWDDSSIGVFSKKGELLQRIDLPVKRPTNCKFDLSQNQLWITSAYEGLTNKQLLKYPLSGDTFVFDVKIL